MREGGSEGGRERVREGERGREREREGERGKVERRVHVGRKEVGSCLYLKPEKSFLEY